MADGQIWCRFQAEDGPSYGLVEGDTVIRVEGSPFAEHRVTAKAYPRDGVKLLVPVIPGRSASLNRHW